MGSIADSVLDHANSALITALATKVAELQGLNPEIGGVVSDIIRTTELEVATKDKERTLAIIAKWPVLEGEFEDGKVPSCSSCSSTDIRRDPQDIRHWGCAECGLNSWSVFRFFPLK
jgi:hypothetical protein